MNLSELTALISPERVKTRAIDRIAYANDASYFWLAPQVVVQPNSLDEIRGLFRFSQRERIPMTFRAAGTSLSGQAVTDGILVDISKHWGAYAVEDGGALLRAQPGIVGGFLNAVLKPYGRRIGPDPASIDACMLGGILANNSSGMCCGVTENAYRTIHSMTFMLPNGFVLDSAAPDAQRIFEGEQPHIAQGLLDLKKRLMAAGTDPHLSHPAKGPGDSAYFGRGARESLAERVRRRYQMKNTNGYLLNAFLDFDSPLDMLVHLLIGSEGTLGFIAEAVLHTLPDLPRRYTGMLYFRSVQDAAAAIAPLRESGVRAAEIMDRAALRAVAWAPGAPEILRTLPEGAAAILAEYQAADVEALQTFKKAAERTLRQLRLLHDPEFTEDPLRQAALWKPRKGIIASVGAMRLPGTTSLIEDVAFPVPRLADAVSDLQALFTAHGYAEGVIYGHAKDGNLHFQINQAFDNPDEVQRFDRFVRDLVRVVSGKYDGALKAEHGTGRNMAPFVEAEWGAEALGLMRDLKALLDPDGMLNPGVILNPNPQAHITDLKRMTPVSPIVDACIECGFCESKCPSRRLTLSPRQRIVVQREIARLKESERELSQETPQALPISVNPVPEKDLLAALETAFIYDGIETCAVDGLCATACPVGINTGDLVKQMRSQQARGAQVAGWAAAHFALVEWAVGWGVRLGHVISPVGGEKKAPPLLAKVARAAEKVTGLTLPKWNHAVPHVPEKLPASKMGTVAEGESAFIYFPSCISRQLGKPPASDARYDSLAETLMTVANRAGVRLVIPADVVGVCCGMPFHSKGYDAAYKVALHHAIDRFWAWSAGGKYPIVIDTTSCTHSLHACTGALLPDDLARYEQMTLLDSVAFIHDTLLPRLKLHPLDEDVVLHPNCSARKMGLDAKLLAIAQACARSASVPLNLGCCAFAGDRGLLYPELTASATEKEAAEVLARDYGGYYASNITCEMGMREATGKDYVGIVYLVERASRPTIG